MRNICEILHFFITQVVIFAEKGKNDQSFIAVDEFAFLQTEAGCDFKPKEAVPTEPPPTTSTPEPTEPPSGKGTSSVHKDWCLKFDHM